MCEDDITAMAQLKEEKDLTSFDPEWYMQELVLSDEAANNMKGDVEVFHKFFTDHNLSGKRLLDVGTGPTIHTLITACNHVDEIYLSDFLPQNLQYLEKWRKGEKRQSEQLIDHVMDLEGRQMTAGQRESDLKSKVKGMLPIDVTLSKPLGDASSYSQFDIVVSSYCIETAVFTVDGYAKCVENVSSLLKKDGFLILCACLNGNSYQIGDYKYKAVSITKEGIQSALRQAGLVVIATEELAETDYDAKYLSFDSYLYILARK
ncbi:nicotinamide N-methyltransferase-like isoform X1 [Argopecten irradians]|uniref:nicotinamide N-methyltransferase-like isoform X1 n=2 Tax=Argopecten irradians TaxID=31199 RepID=UPI0037199D7F